MSTPTSVEITAESVEQAIEKGLNELGVGPSQVIVEVIEEPTRGLFGLGAKNARVRLQLLAPPPRKDPPKPASPAPVPPPESVRERVPEPAPAPEPVTEADVVDTDAFDYDADAFEDDDDFFEDDDAFAEEEDDATVPVRPTEKVQPAYDPDEDDFFDDADGFADDDVTVPAHQTGKAQPAYDPDDDDFFEGDDAFAEEEDDVTVPVRPTWKAQAAFDPDDDDFFNEDGTYEESDDTSFSKPPVRRQREEKQDYTPPAQRQREEKQDYTPPGERYHKQPSEVEPRDSSSGRSKPRRDDESESIIIETPPIVFPEGVPEFEIADQIIHEVLNLMEIDATVTVFQAPPSDRDEEDGPPWILNIEGDGDRIGDLVGKRGDTLTALQYLTRLIVSKQTETRANIIVDVNGYRDSRSDKLEKLAHRMADQAVQTERVINMEPMPAHERRVIHMVLRGRDDVETESKGQGSERRVTIVPKNGNADQ